MNRQDIMAISKLLSELDCITEECMEKINNALISVNNIKEQISKYKNFLRKIRGYDNEEITQR